jgi:predicted RNase H-like HicB family nuclease
LVRLLEENGFRIVKEKGSIRYYGKPGWQRPYSLVIEATEEPDYFGFFSPDLEGFTGVGHSVEDCLYKAKWGMKEHVELLRERGLPVPANNSTPKIVIQNAGEHAPAT